MIATQYSKYVSVRYSTTAHPSKPFQVVGVRTSLCLLLMLGYGDITHIMYMSRVEANDLVKSLQLLLQGSDLSEQN